MLPADSPARHAEMPNPVIGHDSNGGTSRVLCRSRFHTSAKMMFFGGPGIRQQASKQRLHVRTAGWIWPRQSPTRPNCRATPPAGSRTLTSAARHSRLPPTRSISQTVRRIAPAHKIAARNTIGLTILYGSVIFPSQDEDTGRCSGERPLQIGGAEGATGHDPGNSQAKGS